MPNSSLDKPWSLYKTGVPFSPSCRSLDVVSHVCHIPVAVRILEDGYIRADLINDDSILRDDRLRVVWTSPNHWADGYRYGNVRLSFDWQTLCRGKNFYWVEVIKHNPDACRILISPEDRGFDKRLIPFDPFDRDGPWMREPMGADFWNGHYTLEFMIEGDIPLELCNKMDFVNHHQFQCCIDPKTCGDRGLSNDKAATLLLGKLASRYMEIKTPGLLEKAESGKVRAILNVCAAADRWIRECNKSKPESWGSVGGGDPRALVLARAILNAFTSGHPEDATALMSLFKDLSDVHTCVQQVIAQTVGLSEPSGLEL